LWTGRHGVPNTADAPGDLLLWFLLGLPTALILHHNGAPYNSSLTLYRAF